VTNSIVVVNLISMFRGKYGSGSGEFRSRLAQGRLRQIGFLETSSLSPRPPLHQVEGVTNRVVGLRIVTYGCEAWSLTKDERSELRSFEMKSYRHALQRAGRLRVSNTILFILADCKPLLQAQCRRRRKFSYFSVVRHCSMEKDVMPGMCPGSRRHGGQRRQWMNHITTWLSQAAGKPISMHDAVTLAQDRVLFCEMVHKSANAVGSGVSD